MHGRLSTSGRLVVHEPRGQALNQAKSRLQRAAAGRDVAPISFAKSKGNLKRWEGTANWDLVDAPCTNTGSLRRHPECKYRIFELDDDIGDLSLLLHTQRRLLHQAVSLLRPGGSLVYSTCSSRPEENEEQATWA